MKICIIFNKYSGSFARLGDDPATFVQSTLNRIGHGDKLVTVKVIEGQDITKTVHDSIEEGFDVITASGGDGTINSVVNALRDSGKILGVIPMGTFNNFSKDTGIPIAFDEAVKNLIEGEARTIDVAEVNGHLFVNNSSIGQYPTAVVRREEDRKKYNMNKMVAMMFAVLRTSLLSRSSKIRVELEGSTSDVFKTPLIFIGNNRYELAPYRIGRRQNLQSGFLCGYGCLCTNSLCALHLIFLTLFNQLKLSHKFVEKTFQEITLHSEKKNLEVSMDGEVKRLETPLHYKIHPKALKVMLPK